MLDTRGKPKPCSWTVQALRSGLNHPPKDIEAEVAAIYERKAAMKAAMEAKRKPKTNC